MQKDVLDWYFDQIGAYIGIFISMILLITIVKRLHFNSSETQNVRYPLSLTFWIYSLYISSFSLMIFITSLLIGLSLFSGNNQLQTCRIINICTVISAGAFHNSIFNLFMERLYISFKNTLFGLSWNCNVAIRSIFCLIWTLQVIMSAIYLDPSPYNIYDQKVDFDGYGVTCSVLASVKENLTLKLLLFSSGVIIFSGNIFVWSLFLIKLRKLRNLTRTSNNIESKDDLIILMKEQTLIVALAVSSTLILYIIQMTGFLGQLFVTLDFVVTPFIIFLSFKFNRYYFEKLKCDKLALYCCSIFERKREEIEMKMAEIVVNKSNSPPIPSLAVHDIPSIVSVPSMTPAASVTE